MKMEINDFLKAKKGWLSPGTLKTTGGWVSAEIQPCRDCGGIPTKTVAMRSPSSEFLGFFCDRCYAKSAFVGKGNDLILSDTQKGWLLLKPLVRKNKWTIELVHEEIELISRHALNLYGDAVTTGCLLMSDLVPDNFSVMPFDVRLPLSTYDEENATKKLQEGLVPIGWVINTTYGSKSGVLPRYRELKPVLEKPVLDALKGIVDDMHDQLVNDQILLKPN